MGRARILNQLRAVARQNDDELDRAHERLEGPSRKNESTKVLLLDFSNIPGIESRDSEIMNRALDIIREVTRTKQVLGTPDSPYKMAVMGLHDGLEDIEISQIGVKLQIMALQKRIKTPEYEIVDCFKGQEELTENTDFLYLDNISFSQEDLDHINNHSLFQLEQIPGRLKLSFLEKSKRARDEARSFLKDCALVVKRRVDPIEIYTVSSQDEQEARLIAALEAMSFEPELDQLSLEYLIGPNLTQASYALQAGDDIARKHGRQLNDSEVTNLVNSNFKGELANAITTEISNSYPGASSMDRAQLDRLARALFLEAQLSMISLDRIALQLTGDTFFNLSWRSVLQVFYSKKSKNIEKILEEMGFTSFVKNANPNELTFNATTAKVTISQHLEIHMDKLKDLTLMIKLIRGIVENFLNIGVQRRGLSEYDSLVKLAKGHLGSKLMDVFGQLFIHEMDAFIKDTKGQMDDVWEFRDLNAEENLKEFIEEYIEALANEFILLHTSGSDLPEA